MGYIFDPKAADGLEAWYDTTNGQAILRLQKDMIIRLLKPIPGQRLLDVGCGSGRHMQFFKREGLSVSGVDPSPWMLNLARTRLGQAADLHQGSAEDLPFEDNEFDLVTMITCLEFVDDAQAAVAEAFRVARQRVFIGVLNRLSLTSLGRRVEGWLRRSFYTRARFFSLWELSHLVRQAGARGHLHWATVGLLPPDLACRASSFEARPIVQRSPFGAFLGLVADVRYRWRTDNLVISPARDLLSRHHPSPRPVGYVRRSVTEGLDNSSESSCRPHRSLPRPPSVTSQARP